MSIRWERPTVQNIRQLIKHPAFAGAYVYGRRHWRRVQGGGEPAPENRLIGQFVELWDHHEGYISKEEYLENQRILALNAKGPNQSQLGPGPALLGGRCVCARHGGMAGRYPIPLRELLSHAWQAFQQWLTPQLCRWAGRYSWPTRSPR